MSVSQRPSRLSLRGLPPTVWERLEAVIQRFEDAWRAGRQPDPADFLPPGGPERQALLAELVHTDLHYRLNRGEPIRIEQYLGRFPELRETETALVELVLLEWDLRRGGDPGTGADEYICRFPEYASQLLGRFRTISAPHAQTPTTASRSINEAALDLRGYELLEPLGRGGMGEVFRGTDPALGRDLAVKVLRPELRGNTDAEARFQREARLTGALQHPNIVPVHNLGRLPDGRLYYTMKLVRGRTLAEMLAEGTDPARLPGLLGIFEQVCQAVAYAHSKGVIHRDLKPANVMVGSFGEVQVMDWGLAKVLQGDASTNTPAAQTGAGGDTLRRVWRIGCTADGGRTGVVGTPAYMPPEQARDGARDVDERADVFGLGAILCEILTGRPPYDGESSDEVLRRAADGDTAQALARLASCGAGGELVVLCQECLAVQREGRPQDGRVVAERVQVYQAEVQERLRRAELERAAAAARLAEAKATAAAEHRARRRTRALAVTAVALVVVAAGGGLFVQYVTGQRRAEQVRRESEQRQAVGSALEQVTALRDQMHFREASILLQQARQTLGEFGLADLRETLEVAEGELALAKRLDDIHQRLHYEARAAAREYEAVFRDAGLGKPGDDAATVAARVQASRLSGQLVAALDGWAFCAARADNPELKTWLLAVARHAAPDTWGDRFRDPAVWRDPRALGALAEELLRDGGSKLDELSPQSLEALGYLLGAGAEAVPLLRAAQRRYPNDYSLNGVLAYALTGPRQNEAAAAYAHVAVALRPDSAAAHCNLGALLVAMKDLDGASSELRTAIALDPKQVLAHTNLAGVLFDKLDVDGAISECRTAIALDPEHADAHHNLGACLMRKNDLDGAISECRTAIALEPKRADLYHSLASALSKKKDRDGAIAALRQTISLDPKHADAHYKLGNALAERGDFDGAIAMYRRSLQLLPNYPEAHCNLGQVLLMQGRSAEALEQLRRGHILGNTRAGWPYPSEDWVRRGEHLVELDRKLPAVLRGEVEPASAHERLELATLCWTPSKRLYTSAARLAADAFADQTLPAHVVQQQRYAAARAALAAAGHAEGANSFPPDKVVAGLRYQALRWLRADLTLSARMADSHDPAAKRTVREKLLNWQRHKDLASVRDQNALSRLPQDERTHWHAFWEEVAALLKRAREQ
jgi:tetratricopeptide (TPR) repeat protein